MPLFAGGVRQEWLGSFREGRFPVGAHIGIRTLFSRRVGMRVEYRYHRVLGDAVSDFDEHLLGVGLSVLFRYGSGP